MAGPPLNSGNTLEFAGSEVSFRKKKPPDQYRTDSWRSVGGYMQPGRSLNVMLPQVARVEVWETFSFLTEKKYRNN
jgi:hypothetical protein